MVQFEDLYERYRGIPIYKTRDKGMYIVTDSVGNDAITDTIAEMELAIMHGAIYKDSKGIHFC